MSFIEESLIPDEEYDILLREFVNSTSFNNFKKIMRQLYLNKLIDFHHEKNTTTMDKGLLQIYLTLPEMLEENSQNINLPEMPE